jgi:hypothetical protein
VFLSVVLADRLLGRYCFGILRLVFPLPDVVLPL